MFPSTPLPFLGSGGVKYSMNHFTTTPTQGKKENRDMFSQYDLILVLKGRLFIRSMRILAQ